MSRHLETSTLCPGCSASIDEASLIAIYGHGDDTDHEHLPLPPKSRRIDPSPPVTEGLYVPYDNDRQRIMCLRMLRGILFILIFALSVVLGQ
jgi:hypothetical protein